MPTIEVNPLKLFEHDRKMVLAKVVISSLVLVAKGLVGSSQFVGDPAFTALWYATDTVDFVPEENRLGIENEFARVQLPYLTFPDGFQWSLTYDLIPTAVSDAIVSRADFFAINIFATCSPPADGRYEFRFMADDGIRIFVNGVLVTPPKEYTVSAVNQFTFSLDLVASRQDLWEIHYFEKRFSAALILQYFDVAEDRFRRVDSTWCTPRAPPEPFQFNGLTYRALDGTSPSASERSCQGNNLYSATFNGDDIAVESNDVYALVTRFVFGTSCLIVRDASNTTNFVAVATKPSSLELSNRYCDMSGVSVERSFGAFRVVGDTSCQFRFLVQGDGVLGAPDHSFAAASEANLQSIFFNRATFATLRNINPEARRGTSTGGNSKAFKLPPGYELAPNANLSRAALLGPVYSFGVNCFVFADGSAQDSVTGLPCTVANGIDTTSLPGYIIDSGGIKGAILIQNPRGREREATYTWESQLNNIVVVGTHLIEESGWLYGSILLTEHGSARNDLCSSLPVALPKGFSIVPSGDLGLIEVAKRGSFGTSCLVTADGSGYVPSADGGSVPCAARVLQATIDSKTFALVDSCPAAITIRIELPPELSTRSPTSISISVAPTTPTLETTSGDSLTGRFSCPGALNVFRFSHSCYFSEVPLATTISIGFIAVAGIFLWFRRQKRKDVARAVQSIGIMEVESISRQTVVDIPKYSTAYKRPYSAYTDRFLSFSWGRNTTT